MTITTTIDASDEPRVSSPLEQARAELNARVLEHPFMVRCRQGTVPFGELRNFLAQHGRYSSYFTRYLCALISQLDDGGDVLLLAENLVDELGYGADHGVPHARIYSDMLRHLGIDLEDHPIFPETQNLIDTMFMLCRQPHGLAGLGALCLGAEAIVPATYTHIVEGLVSHGVPEEQLTFFAIHISCDDEHAKTMHLMIERLSESSPVNTTKIVSAGELAVSARLRFFDGLSRRLP